MLMALQLLCALDPSLVSSDKTLPPFVPALDGAAGELAIHILDIKNRFESPTSCGWCDVIMRAYFREDPHRHVFEIQLAHAERELHHPLHPLPVQFCFFFSLTLPHPFFFFFFFF